MQPRILLLTTFLVITGLSIPANAQIPTNLDVQIQRNSTFPEFFKQGQRQLEKEAQQLQQAPSDSPPVLVIRDLPSVEVNPWSGENIRIRENPVDRLPSQPAPSLNKQ